MNIATQNTLSSIKPIENTILILLLIIMSYTVSFARMGRARIENNTIVTDEGTRLRGGTFWLYGWIPSKTKWAMSETPWMLMNDFGFNAVRLACAYRPEKEGNYSLAKYDTILDAMIARAENNGVYAIIDYHPTPGAYYNIAGSSNSDTYENNRQHAIDFWIRFANRYRNRTNVIFELINEPIFSSPNDYNDTIIDDFENLWRICDSIAPEVPIIVLSYCQVGNHASQSIDWPAIKAAELEGIDWKKTAVGFHSYWRDSSTRIEDLQKKYPCINTEFMCLDGSKHMKIMDGYEYHGTLMEKLKISWLQWDILDRKESVEQKLPKVLQNLKDSSLFWPKDSSLRDGKSSIISTSPPKNTKDAQVKMRKIYIYLSPQHNYETRNDLFFYLNGKMINTTFTNHNAPAIIVRCDKNLKNKKYPNF